MQVRPILCPYEGTGAYEARECDLAAVATYHVSRCIMFTPFQAAAAAKAAAVQELRHLQEEARRVEANQRHPLWPVFDRAERVTRDLQVRAVNPSVPEGERVSLEAARAAGKVTDDLRGRLPYPSEA